MNYKEINDKWKVFLTENTFREEIVIKPGKDKKKRKKGKKEIIVSEKDDVNEWEEFEEAVINEPSGSEGNEATNSVEEESLEEMSAMSGGAVQGYAGNAFAPKKKIKPY
jgi:flagella basal body P-ring formation protein FlgA